MHAKMKETNKLPKIIVLITLLVFSALVSGCSQIIDAKTAECIGKKSLLYIREGCPACEKQKALFGENFHYINIVDCNYDVQKCLSIQYIPTWDFGNGTIITGILSANNLKEITGC